MSLSGQNSPFPSVDRADSDGLLAISLDLDAGLLERAYRQGIFPWPADRRHVLWFAPPVRAVIDFDAVHVPARLRRDLKKNRFHFTVDTCFARVIAACARVPRNRQDGTWITPKIIRAYNAFHRAGHAHSFEAWDEAGELVGGLYGVGFARFFAGESMFHLRTGASKFALLETIAYLRARGVAWMDVQVLNPLTAAFGAYEIDRETYSRRLREAIA